MKQVVQVRLEADTAQLDVLARTLVACNATANLVSRVAHAEGAYRSRDLRAITYAQARQQAGLGAQVAQSCIRKVADAYTTLRANLRNGRYGTSGSPQRVKVEAAPIRFRSLAAQPFDDRCLSWNHDIDSATDGSVSIWTVEGRVKNLRFTGEPDQIALLRAHRRGETDLVMPFIQVDPAYTSQRCTHCGYIDRRNRTSQDAFVCRDCGFTAEHADILGADNIAHRAPTTWAPSTVPSAA